MIDVACGTGVLFPDYRKRKVCLTGIDISSEMVKKAKSKFPEIDVICGDVESFEFDKQFDVVMVYNAFPHFSDPAFLIKRLSELVKEKGRLCVAHGMSREALLKHHQRAKNVSIDLLEIDELVELFKPYFDIEVSISDENMYQLVGRKR